MRQPRWWETAVFYRSTRGHSWMPTAMAWATSRAFASGSTTSSGSASTRSGSRRSTARRWQISATTSPTTREIDPLFGSSRISTAWSPRRTRADSRSSSTSCRTTPPTSTRGFSKPRVAGQPEARLVHLARPAPDGGPPNNWLCEFGGARLGVGRSDGPVLLHAFLPEQPDLNWRNPEVEARCSTSCASGWTRRRRLPRRHDRPHHQRIPSLRDNPPNPDFATAGTRTSRLLRSTAHRPEVHEVIAEMRGCSTRTITAC